MNISIILKTGAHFEYDNAETIKTSANLTVISSKEETLTILDNESIEKMEIKASINCVNFRSKV
jgi:hypothetical protein